MCVKLLRSLSLVMYRRISGETEAKMNKWIKGYMKRGRERNIEQSTELIESYPLIRRLDLFFAVLMDRWKQIR